MSANGSRISVCHLNHCHGGFMRAGIFICICSLVCLAGPTAENQVHPRPPGLRDADQQINKPLDPPSVTSPASPDPLKLKQEAEELAQLSAGVPPRVSLASRGQLPKDLPAEMYRKTGQTPPIRDLSSRSSNDPKKGRLRTYLRACVDGSNLSGGNPRHMRCRSPVPNPWRKYRILYVRFAKA
jgi:hypothetical protein